MESHRERIGTQLFLNISELLRSCAVSQLELSRFGGAPMLAFNEHVI